MKSMKKSRMALLVVMMLGLMIGMVMTVHAGETDEYPLWIGGEQVTSENCVSNQWSYDDESKTLRLNNYSYSGGGYNTSGSFYGIYYSGIIPLNLVLEGVNSVACTGTVNITQDNSGSYGLYSNGSINISGTGSLEVKGGTIRSETYIAFSCGIHSNNLTVSGSAKVTAIGGTVTGTGVGGSYGAYISKMIKVEDSAILKAEGGTSSIHSLGIDSGWGLDVGESATLIATGGMAGSDKNSRGIFCFDGLAVVRDSAKVTATAGAGGSSIGVEGDLTINSVDTSFVASGMTNAVSKTVKNAIVGTGWTNTAGTEGKARIPVSTAGQELAYKKVQFPAVSDPVTPSTDPTPTAKQQTTEPTVTTQTAAAEEPITIMTAPKFVKAKAKGKRVTVSWKKIKKNKRGKALLKKVASIEIEYSTDPNFTKETTVTTTVGKKKTKVVLNLQRKTTYFIRVKYRAKDGGVSNWSSTKRVRTK